MFTDEIHDLVEGDVLIVVTGFRFAGRCEERLGKLVGLSKACRQFDAANLAGVLVILPTGADQVTPNDGFDGQWFEPLDHERSLSQLLAQLRIVDDVVHGQGRQLIVDDIGHHAEPEQGYLCQYLALARHRVRHDDVKRRQAIGGDDQQVLVVDAVDVADFAASDHRKVRDRGFE